MFGTQSWRLEARAYYLAIVLFSFFILSFFLSFFLSSLMTSLSLLYVEHDGPTFLIGLRA